MKMCLESYSQVIKRVWKFTKPRYMLQWNVCLFSLYVDYFRWAGRCSSLFTKKCIAFDLWYILNGMVFEKYFSFSLFSSLLILEYNARLLTYMFYGKRDTWQRLFPSISRINLRKRNNLLTNFLCWRMIFS